MHNELLALVGENEKILYEGKPNKWCYLFEGIFNPMLPFAIIWALFDSLFFKAFLGVGSDSPMGSFVLIFLLFHMMPVWIYLIGVIFIAVRYKNTYYVVTDSAVYMSHGIFTKNYDNKPFAELSHVDLHRGVFDQIFNVGDIRITTNQVNKNGSPAIIGINSISNYAEVYNLVKKLQKDVYADTQFPNDYRPAENHGYKTEYKG